MDGTSLGDRMKLYESAFKQSFPIRFPLLLRLDGVHFSKNVKRWKSEKPFDARLTHAMQMTCKGLAEKIPGVQVVYSQSDEITVLIRDDMTHTTQPWHGKEVNKIMSVAAAKATNLFNFHFHGESFGNGKVMFEDLAEFDCRGYILPEQEILNAFLWRQRDCEKNSVQMLARTVFSDKELHKKNGSEMQDMMMLQHKLNWNDMPTAFKRGFCVVKKDCFKEVPKRGSTTGDTELINRPAWTVDLEIPVFSQDPEYITRFTRICNG